MRLTVHQGDIRITTPGTVIDGLDVRGRILVDAPNVVIRNSIVRGPDAPPSNSYALIGNTSAQKNLVIIDTELAPTVKSGWVNGIMGSEFVAERLDIHDVIDGLHIIGDNVTLKSSWLHDNLHYERDPGQGGSPSHDDSVQIQNGSNIVLAGNNISGATNTGIQITQDRGRVNGVTISGNIADGGGCVVNIAEKGRGPVSRVTVSDNIFGRSTKVADCAVIAPPSSRPTMLRNFFVDGAPVVLSRG